MKKKPPFILSTKEVFIMTDNKTSYPYIHRDLSWLSFNYRVLQEAKDPNNPLLERLRFLAIYSNNLREFYLVRVAHHRNLLRVGKKTQKELDYTPKIILKNINRIVNQQQDEFTEILENDILLELEKQQIFFIKAQNYTKDQKSFVHNYFKDNLLPFVQPVLLQGDKIKPFLNNGALYLTVVLQDKKKRDKINYALVNIPSQHYPRFIMLPSRDNKHEVTILDEVVRHSIIALFPGYEVLGSYSTKMSRDAALYIDDEFSGNLIQKIKASLSKRKVGLSSRTVFDRNIPTTLLDYLINIFDIEKIDLHPEGRYHNNFDFLSFPNFGKYHLLNRHLEPLPSKLETENKTLFDRIDEEDHLFYYPYHSYECVLEFFETAINDPLVTEIKITQYRVAKKSGIMNTLIKGVKNGKKVTVFIEVKARFDEAANLDWGDRLEKAGIKVIYSFPGLKVHCKLALIIKNVDGFDYRYTYLSTGNFNEKTAEIYGDYGYFTSNNSLCDEVSRVFDFLETVILPSQEFEHLLVGQFNLREKINEKIETEINNAKQGKKAYILFKLNSIEDKQVIIKLYEASDAGVKIDLIIRGICCIVPGIKGLSENIRTISIVDRYLEHTRIYNFYADGDNEIYLSSADLMERNLSSRIEVAFPILSPPLKEEIMHVLDLQLKDNTKARIIGEKQNNSYVKKNDDVSVQSQLETYYYYERKHLNQ